MPERTLKVFSSHTTKTVIHLSYDRIYWDAYQERDSQFSTQVISATSLTGSSDTDSDEVTNSVEVCVAKQSGLDLGVDDKEDTRPPQAYTTRNMYDDMLPKMCPCEHDYNLIDGDRSLDTSTPDKTDQLLGTLVGDETKNNRNFRGNAEGPRD